MIKNIYVLIVLVVFTFNSCAPDPHEEVTPDEPTGNIYLNFTLQGSYFEISSADNYSLFHKGSTFKCSKDWVSGSVSQSLEDRTETKFITSVNFYVTKKVFKDELDPINDLSYLSRMINAGNIGFPLNTNGYYEIYDLENSVFQVNRNLSAEAYLNITTKDKYYRSSSVVPNERDPNSFIRIEKIIENTGKDSYEYPYLIEGIFKVNLFEGMYGTSSQMVEGNFRWPISRIENSQLFICE